MNFKFWKKAAPKTETKIKNFVEFLRYPKDRRIVPVDTGNNERHSLPNHERARSVAEARHLAQNDVNVRGFLQAFKLHGVGDCGGNVIFRTEDETWNSKAHQLMKAANRDCSFRVPGIHISEYLKTAVQSMIRDGDFAIVVDTDITEGKFLTFEADQICEINPQEWEKYALENGFSWFDPATSAKKPCFQESGVVVDNLGRALAIVTCSTRGVPVAPLKNCTVWPIDKCHIILEADRFDQYRGNSMLLPMVQILSDFRDLIASEIKSAKRQAQDAIVVKQKNSVAALLAQTGLTSAQLTEGTDMTLAPLNPQRYENLEDQFGGAVEYIGNEDEIAHLKTERPNPDISNFEEYTKRSCGLSLGLYRMFSIGEVSTSYSAARCELWLTQRAVSCLQKLMERRVLAFRNTKLIESWVQSGQLPPIPNGEHPEDTYTVEWPKPPEINPGAEVDAAMKRIKAGLSNWDIENGSENKKILGGLAKNLEFMKDNGLDMLAFFETKAGAVNPPTPEEQQFENENDDTTKKPENKKS